MATLPCSGQPPPDTVMFVCTKKLTGDFFVHTIMDIVFDRLKNERNILLPGLSFERAAEFDFESAVYLLDDRRQYGEARYIAVGYLDGRLHVLCFTESPTGLRVISFRKANAREARKYGKPQTID
ncbi:hypothetical protein L602_000200000800 [Cupriavidus gilardii J11]|uniref:Uncharacterized protein n=1 Tax=Cupriavidus gilardii J11 TaxID=936133 RepID=A0A562BP08_9BURK|nr:BrnT family toxin [Cupriavidus gilardii]TWG86679.1 hypothetical protein L602_000200000800 [Cupriavidus gilardii J11]